jgi:REP element-mobilizing transposase RayT
MGEFRFFDADADFSIIERRLPHWQQAGTMCFITWRAGDSMPRPVMQRWIADRNALLQQHGIAPNPNWKDALSRLPRPVRQRLKWMLTERWDEYLDQGHGECVLQQPELSEIVANSLLHFDGERYELTDFVVMPNHVHLLAAFPSEDAMLQQCESWKRYTAVRVNRQLKQRGQFWQDDGFDHWYAAPSTSAITAATSPTTPARPVYATGSFACTRRR